MTVITKNIGRLPLNKGNWSASYVNPKTSQNGYGKKFRVIRYGCELESKIENNTYDPISWDGAETFTVDTAHWFLVSGNPKNWLDGQDKPATTGTTGNYPYNGMGRVVLKKNMVSGVNTLTQAMISATNTIYVIQYDFVLGEDIIVPENCVLEFEGGSFDGSHVVTGSKMPTNKIYTPEMFGAGKTSDDTKAIQSALNLCHFVKMSGNYNVYASRIYQTSHSCADVLIVPSNTDIQMDGSINYLTNNIEEYQIFKIYNSSNINIHGCGKYQGDRLIHIGTTGEWGHAISINCSHDIVIDGGEMYNFWGDGVYCGYINSDENPTTTCNYNITIKNLYIHNYRRQGVSICGGHHFKVLCCRIFDQDSVSYGKNETCIDIETSVAANPISDIEVYNIESNERLNIVGKDLQTKLENISISKVRLLGDRGSLSLGDCTNSVIVNNCQVNNITTRPSRNDTSHNNPTIQDCSIKSMTLYAGLKCYTSTIEGIYVPNPPGDINYNTPAQFYNCVCEFVGTNNDNSFRLLNLLEINLYDCNINFKGASDVYQLLSKSVSFYRCKIRYNDTAYGQYEAHNCEIIVELNGTGNRIFYNDYLKLYNCLIRIVSNKVATLYRLNRNSGTAQDPVYNSLVNLGSIVIDELQGRVKTEGTNAKLYDAGTTYICKDENGDYVLVTN